VKSTRSIRFFTILSLAIVAISAISWLSLGKITASIKRVDAFAGLNTRPERTSSAVNYLLVGSDTREGLTKAELKALKVGSVKTAAGKRSDTIILVHISKDRDKATIISIPRDTFAEIPAYRDKNGNARPSVYSKLNSSFNWGGAPLLVETLESMTGLRIDHYIEVNFVGFARMVDSLGGIEVCTKKDINDPKSHLSVLRKATSAGVLLNPVKLLNFLNSALAAVTTDAELNRDDLLTLGKQLKNLSASKVRTLTVPLQSYNYSHNGVTASVLWDPVLAPELWKLLRDDLPITKEVVPSASASASPSPSLVDKFKTRTADENPCGALK